MRDIIPAALAGQRVDRVASLMSDRSRSSVKADIADGRVQINGVGVSSPSHRVREGDVIEFDLPDDSSEQSQPVVANPLIQVPVIHEDAEFVVIDKPVGLVVHPGAGHGDDTLVNGLLALYPEAEAVGEPERPGVVHRLDRGTSGLLVWARTERAYVALCDQLADRRVSRIYLTLVGAVPDSSRGMIDAPIGRSRRNRTRMAVIEDGREARTEFEMLEKFERPSPASLLRCRLDTGRTHQIRVHLGAIGLPVLGDTVYGSADPFGIGRPLLHAHQLSFEHPLSGEEVHFEAPIPDDFASALESFRTS